MRFRKCSKPLDLVESQIAESEARKVEESSDPFVDSLIDHANDQMRRIPLKGKIKMTDIRG